MALRGEKLVFKSFEIELFPVNCCEFRSVVGRGRALNQIRSSTITVLIKVPGTWPNREFPLEEFWSHLLHQ